MLNIKSVFASKTIITNIVIGVVGLFTAFGLLPEACNAGAAAEQLGTTVPGLLGTAITLLAGVSSFFRIKATAALV